MTQNDPDLQWIADRRPTVPDPDPSTTARLRHELLADGGEAPAPHRARTAAPAAPRRRRRRLAAAAVPVLAASAVVFVASGSDVPGPTGGVPRAEAAPLHRLATDLRQDPAPTGDATLVIRRQLQSDGSMIPGADLYVDGGGYYYARKPSGLPAAIADGKGARTQQFARTLAAASAAFDGSIEAARERLIDAAREPGDPPAKAGVDRETRDNWVWGSSVDALVAGAGRPKVRAGVLHLIESIKGVEVQDTTVDGRHVLRISASVFGVDYTETLLVDAESGIPIDLAGGVPGQKPQAHTEYSVKRTTVAAVTKDGGAGSR